MTDEELLRSLLEANHTVEAEKTYLAFKERIWYLVGEGVRRDDSAGLLSRLRASLEIFQSRWREFLASAYGLPQAARIHALVVCGQLAAIRRKGSPASARSALEDVLSGSVSLRELPSDDELALALTNDESVWRQFMVGVATSAAWPWPVSSAWVDDTLHTLWGHRRAVRTTRRVAVAGVRRPGGIAQSKGFLTLLVLEVLPGGRGEVFQAPEDASRTATDGHFDRAMENAWLSAGASVTAHLKECGIPHDVTKHSIDRFDGRWRLIGEWDALPSGWWAGAESDPLAEAKDDSASAAAARGWVHALAETFPDNGVIVLGAVAGREGELAVVGGVRQKIEAIVGQNATRRATKGDVLDTVVLVSDPNDEARKILGPPTIQAGLLVFRLSRDANAPDRHRAGS